MRAEKKAGGQSIGAAALCGIRLCSDGKLTERLGGGGYKQVKSLFY